MNNKSGEAALIVLFVVACFTAFGLHMVIKQERKEQAKYVNELLKVKDLEWKRYVETKAWTNVTERQAVGLDP